MEEMSVDRGGAGSTGRGGYGRLGGKSCRCRVGVSSRLKVWQGVMG